MHPPYSLFLGCSGAWGTALTPTLVCFAAQARSAGEGEKGLSSSLSILSPYRLKNLQLR